MFIQTETTPNPATLKFLPGLSIMDEGTADYQNADDAGNSPTLWLSLILMLLRISLKKRKINYLNHL